MSNVEFWAVINNRILFVSGPLDDSLVKLFKSLRHDPDVAKHIPASVSYDDCKFYRLKSPVSVLQNFGEDENQGDPTGFPVAVQQACLQESNRALINPGRTKIKSLAQVFSADHVYLAIDIPDPLRESTKAIANLRNTHDALFKRLHIIVSIMGKWSDDDVQMNLKGGIITDNLNDLPPGFEEIQDILENKRLYQTDHAQSPDFQHALSYQTEFNRIFAPALEPASCTVESDREFATFFHVLRCFREDVPKLARNGTSSSLKASNFTVHFVQPPFFSQHDASRGFRFQQETSWGFPTFINTTSARDAWRRFTPRSDWMVISDQHQIPFIISEVISNKQQEDRCKMLVEAIALARAGQYLMKSGSKKRFFVVAIYVDASMVASRYIVMQADRCDDTEDAHVTDNEMKVSILQKDFNLTIANQGVDFLREMYNLATQITRLFGDLDQNKRQDLSSIKDIAQNVLSLNSKHTQTKTSGSTIMSTIAEGNEGSSGLQDEKDLGVFEAEDIQNILRQMNYKIEFIPWGHPQLAVIVDKTGDKHGYLKFVEREREISVLQYLTEIESPSNHTISGVRFWPVQGGTVISMPVAGGWLTSLDKPDMDRQLWSVTQQLFEAVAFMHEHGVAHMDIKPQNVIIPPEGGRLSIIDFSVSTRVRGPHVRYNGVVGTEDYIAPEVCIGQYKPMLADLWSCGRTVEELCRCCGPSPDRTKLLEMAGRLMSKDPEARPKMSAVLEWMAAQQGDSEDNVVSSVFRPFPTVSPLCA